MKILLINGSPRMNGNTRTVLKAMEDGFRNNLPGCEIEFVDLSKMHLSPCSACDACQNNGGHCVMKDDSSSLVDKADAADFIVLGTPVYWWGISSQMKMFIDKFYSRGSYFMKEKKSLAVSAIGAAGLEECQYRLIREQFEAISSYLGWNFVSYLPAPAGAPGEIAGNEKYMAQCRDLWRKFHV